MVGQVNKRNWHSTSGETFVTEQVCHDRRDGKRCLTVVRHGASFAVVTPDRCNEGMAIAAGHKRKYRALQWEEARLSLLRSQGIGRSH